MPSCICDNFTVLERPLPQVVLFNPTAALRNTYIHLNYSRAIELNSFRCVLVLDYSEEMAELRTSCFSMSRLLDRAYKGPLFLLCDKVFLSLNSK